MDAERPFSGFVEVPHTADIAIDVFAANLPQLFVQAAQALYHILGIRKGTEVQRKVHLHLTEIDLESLLVSFLEELLFYADQKAVACEFKILVEKNSVDAEMKMTASLSQKREIKAVTYHDLLIHQNANGYQTRIIFDI